jgi:hypothetical protein
MTPVRLNIKISACYGGSTHERLLSESSRPYISVLSVSVSICTTTVHRRTGHHSKSIF